MTSAELKTYIAGQLVVPVTEVAKIINSFDATIDYVNAQQLDDIPDWTALLTFQTDGSDDGKYCKHPDTNGLKRIFETKIDNNIGNEPPTNPAITEDANWREISASAAAAIPEWAPGVYGLGLVIVYHNHSTSGPSLFILLEPTRPFTSANIETEITAGQWAQIAGDSIPSSLQRVVPKTAHGFAVKNLITLDGSGVHVKVSDPSSNKFVGLVTEVVDVDSFRIHTAGYVTGLTGLTAGAIHYAQADGTLGTTETDMPVLFADSATSGYILASGASGGGGPKIATASGTNTYTAAFTPPHTEFPPTGTMIIVQFANTNTGASTLNIDSLAAIPIRRERGAELLAGDLYPSTWYPLVFSSVHAAWILLSPSNVPNSTTAKGLWVDTNGRIRLADGSVYTSATKSWVHTGTDDAATELAKWESLSGDLIMRLFNNQLAEFGGTTSFWRVLDGILSDNAGVVINDNQDKAWKFADKSANEYLVIKSTTGAFSVQLKAVVEYNQGQGFVVRRVHVRKQTTSTGSAWNNIARIDMDNNDQAVSIAAIHLSAYATDGNIAIAHGAMHGMAKRVAGTVTAVVPTFNMVGDQTTAWRIAANDTEKSIDIDFKNDATGRVWEISLDYEYTELILPTV